MLGDDGKCDGAAGCCNATRFRERDPAPLFARVDGFHEFEQRPALCRERCEGGGAVCLSRGIDGFQRGADLGPQVVEALASIGRKIECLEPQRDGEQPRPAFVGKRECGFIVAALDRGVGRLRKQRSRVGDQRTRLGLVVSLAEQQQEGVARARIRPLRRRTSCRFWSSIRPSTRPVLMWSRG